jgi:small ligand-binding sensory domain FIST
MTSLSPAPETAASRFTVAHARADHWGLAAKACLEGLGDAALGANIGFLYATEEFGAGLSSILTFLRETTRIAHWVGAVAPGICTADAEYRDGGALAVMVGHLPEGSFLPFSGDKPGHVLDAAEAWLERHPAALAVVHADPRHPAAAQLVADVAAAAGYLVGGFVSAGGQPAQVADQVVEKGLSGLLLGGIEAVAGLTQGCSPIGPSHEVTEAVDGVLMSLDGQPALDMLKHEAGEIIARDLRRAAGYIHVGLPIEGSDTGDYVVRSLLAIDPQQGWLAVGERVLPGSRMMFVRRDANTAQADMGRMLDDAKARVAGRRVLAALYFSCVARGVHMFGDLGAETDLIRQALGDDVPLIGCYANGEISRDRLYGYTGVLTLILGPGP